MKGLVLSFNLFICLFRMSQSLAVVPFLLVVTGDIHNKNTSSISEIEKSGLLNKHYRKTYLQTKDQAPAPLGVRQSLAVEQR